MKSLTGYGGVLVDRKQREGATNRLRGLRFLASALSE